MKMSGLGRRGVNPGHRVVVAVERKTLLSLTFFSSHRLFPFFFQHTLLFCWHYFFFFFRFIFNNQTDLVQHHVDIFHTYVVVFCQLSRSP